MALPPGPRQSSIVQTLNWVRRPIPFLEEAARKYGDFFRVRLLRTDLIVISNPSVIKQVFTGNGEILHAGAAGADVLTPLVGRSSVLVLDGAAHMRQRRLMLPAFHGARMKAYADAMRDITVRVIARWPTNEPFELHPHTQQITLDVILHTVFGVEDATRMKRFGDQLTRILAMGSSPSLIDVLMPAVLSSARARFIRERKRADEMIYEEIRRRRSAGDAESRSDVLSMLLLAVDDDGKHMTDRELRDQLMTLLAAGHETTATSLAWTFERILSHRTVYEKLRDELERVVGDDPITDANIGKLEYLDAVCKESLRLRPIVPMCVRRIAVPLMVHGFELPAGTILGPSIYLTHRRPDIYPEPDRFNPDRFLGVKPDPYAWLPFGGGIRRCLGMAFALYEMKVVMATILSRAELTLAPGASDRMARRSITFAPSDGVRVVVRTRRRHVAAVA